MLLLAQEQRVCPYLFFDVYTWYIPSFEVREFAEEIQISFHTLVAGGEFPMKSRISFHTFPALLFSCDEKQSYNRQFMNNSYMDKETF